MDARKKLAVFDLDGTLFDTAETNYCAYAAAAQKFGYALDRAQFLREFVGRNYKEFLPKLGVTSQAHFKQIHDEKKRLYPQYLKQAKKNDALFSLIESIRADYVIALATTASRQNTEDILRHFEVDALFDVLVTQEDVPELKPDPGCYVMAMKRAGIKAESTIIFEDSEVGLQAAAASGGFPLAVKLGK